MKALIKTTLALAFLAAGIGTTVASEYAVRQDGHGNSRVYLKSDQRTTSVALFTHGDSMRETRSSSDGQLTATPQMNAHAQSILRLRNQ